MHPLLKSLIRDYYNDKHEKKNNQKLKYKQKQTKKRKKNSYPLYFNKLSIPETNLGVRPYSYVSLSRSLYVPDIVGHPPLAAPIPVRAAFIDDHKSYIKLHYGLG